MLNSPKTQIPFDELMAGVHDSFKVAMANTEKSNSFGLNELRIDESVAFPVEIFPNAYRHIIKETNEKLLFPVDFISSSILYAVSVAIGNSLSLKVKEGWIEQCPIWLALVGRPGTNKSHPFSFALEPLRMKQNEFFRDYKKLLSEFERINALTKEEKQKEGITDNPLPKCKRFILQDFTIESMAEKHNENPRGLGIVVDELATWLGNMNKYSGGSDQEVWLSTWSRKSLLIDRKSMREAISIESPFLCVGGTTQDGILKNLFSGAKQKNGFIDRILFCYPGEIEYPMWNNQNIDPYLKSDYQQLINRILELPLDTDEWGNLLPRELQFSENALNHVVYWYNLKSQILNDCQNTDLASLYSKLEIYLYRFALIIQVMRWASGEGSLEEIEEISVVRAIDLVEYFKNHALKVQSLMNPPELDELDDLKKQLFLSLPDTFRRKEGLSIALKVGVKQTSFDAFIKNDKLFMRPSYGQFKKKIKM